MKTSSKKKRCGKERDSPTCFSNANLPSLGNHIIKYKYRHRDGRWLVVLGIWYLKVPALRQQHQVVGTTDVIKTRWVVWGMKSRDLRRTRRMTVEMVMVVMKIIYRQEVIIVHYRRCGCAKANVLLTISCLHLFMLWKCVCSYVAQQEISTFCSPPRVGVVSHNRIETLVAAGDQIWFNQRPKCSCTNLRCVWFVQLISMGQKIGFPNDYMHPHCMEGQGMYALKIEENEVSIHNV